jgi:TonB family protein
MNPVSDLRNTARISLFCITIACVASMAIAAGATKREAGSLQVSPNGDSRENVIRALRARRTFKSYRMKQEWSTADRRASFVLEFVEPDRSHTIANTDEAIYIGKTCYQRKGSGPWEKNLMTIALVVNRPVPESDINETIKRLGDVRFIGPDTIGDIPVLGYQYALIDASGKPGSPYKMWIGVKDELTYRTEYETECPSKDWGGKTTKSDMVTVRVVTTYSDFDAEIVIDPPEKAALEAAESWLTLVDAGRYSESWNEAASFLKKSYSEETWEKRLGEFAKKELDPIKFRDHRTIQSVQSLPSNRNVQGVVLTYLVTREKPANVVQGAYRYLPIMQTLELVLDTDQVWRVANYANYIPDVNGEPGGYGPGSGGGMGTGNGGGMGPGNGRGVGPGSGYNMGGGDPRLGGGSGGPATAVDTKPIPLNSPQPRYTEEARNNKIQGTVTMRVLVGADGQVKNVRVVRGLPDGLGEQAIQAAYQLKFKPAMKDGKPVAFWMAVSVEFNLGRK